MRIREKLERIAEIVIHAPENHVHSLQAAERLQINIGVAHREIVPLYKRIAEIPGKIGMLEVGFAVGSRREKHDTRIFKIGGRESSERISHGCEIGSKPRHSTLSENMGQRTRSY